MNIDLLIKELRFSTSDEWEYLVKNLDESKRYQLHKTLKRYYTKPKQEDNKKC